ncbi:hypothetical protein FF1_003356 [Malus domestica]
MVVYAIGFTYYLHRLILSRSLYFRNMLHGPCKEAILHRCLYPIASSPFPLSPLNRNCNACLYCSRFRSWSSSSSLDLGCKTPSPKERSDPQQEKTHPFCRGTDSEGLDKGITQERKDMDRKPKVAHGSVA